MGNIYNIVYDKYILPMTKRKPEYVGVELEFPVIGDNVNFPIKEASCSLLEYLIKNHNFKPVKTGKDGCLVRVRSDMNDDISFDYQYAGMELSMGKDTNLVSIYNRFLIYLEIIQKFYKEKYNKFITGMGAHPWPTFPYFEYTQDSYCNAIRKYLKDCTYHRTINFFHAFISSEQTHIDIREDQVVDSLNLFSKLGFVRALLFSNSLAPDFNSPISKSFDKNTICFRDFAWENCELPNTDILDNNFSSLDEVVKFISEKKMFIDCVNGEFRVFNPVTLSEYQKRADRSDNFIDYFRMFNNVLINSLSVLEIRDACTQPLDSILSPTAFSLGLSVNIKESLDVVNNFLTENNTNLKNSELRNLVVSGNKIVSDDIMINFLEKIVNISRKGLISRGFGEEKFIDCLDNRIRLLECPANKQKRLLAEGYTKNQIAEIYSRI